MKDGDAQVIHVPCPLCRRPAAWRENPFRPFCSERCRLIDLGKWASEEYRVAGELRDQPEEGAEGKSDPEK